MHLPVSPASLYSTGNFARYPSRATIEYFNAFPFSSDIFSGRPSLSTRYTFTLRYDPSFFAFVGRYVSTYLFRIESLIREKISGISP